MLQSLTIKNIALIDNLTIELENGFNILTGETGAGKSLIIDSLSLLLGEKADKSLISYGETFASVEAVFYTELESVLAKLEEFGLEKENMIIITRKISSDGKNECRVNGKAFTLSMLKTITAPLMDLHGQFQHQEILKQSNQLETLDDFGGDKIKTEKQAYQKLFFEIKNIKKQLSEFNFDGENKERMLDLYRYQIDEIEQANFFEGEEEQLKEFRMKVLNQEKIMASLSQLSSYFDGGEEGNGITSLIKRCDYEFNDVIKYLPDQNELADRISSVRYEIQDIAETLNDLKDNLTFDEEEAEKNEKRLDLLVLFKKKYGANIHEINEYLKSIKLEYEKMQNSSEIVEKLEAELKVLTNKIIEQAEKLTKIRKSCAKSFEEMVKKELSELSMKGAEFKINFESLDETSFDETGFDRIEFLFTANAGQPLKPLSKVASGGEMSRFMLAVKNITADTDQVDTMIFDEIDTGISGETANILAVKLAKIGKKHQVICVTHLAQVASFGDSHFFISKSVYEGKTKTSLKILNEDERISEIARIIGGEISDYSLSHAKLMLENAKKIK